MDFTVEEVNLMCIFNTSSRTALMAELTDTLPFFDEFELAQLARSMLTKLSKMSDTEFSALEFYPEYEDYDKEV